MTQNASTNDQMILEDKTLYRQLNASNFDLAIVDLIANECRLLLKDMVDRLIIWTLLSSQLLPAFK